MYSLNAAVIDSGTVNVYMSIIGSCVAARLVQFVA